MHARVTAKIVLPMPGSAASELSDAPASQPGHGQSVLAISLRTLASVADRGGPFAAGAGAGALRSANAMALRKSARLGMYSEATSRMSGRRAGGVAASRSAS